MWKAYIGERINEMSKAERLSASNEIQSIGMRGECRICVQKWNYVHSMDNSNQKESD